MSFNFIILLSITILIISSLQIITSLTCEPICQFDFTNNFFPPQCNNIKCHTPQCYYQCDTSQLQQECDSSPFSKPICTAVCTKQAFNSIDINSHCISKCQPAKDICSKCTLHCSTPSCSLACNQSTINLTPEQIKQQPILQQRYHLNCIQHEICQDTQHSIIATISTKDKLYEDYSDGLLIYDDDELSSDHTIKNKINNNNQPRYNVTHSHQQAREQQQQYDDDYDEEESTFGISHLIKKHNNYNNNININDTNDINIKQDNTNQNKQNNDNNNEEETCTDQDDFDHDVEHQNDIEPIDPTSIERPITPHKLKKLQNLTNNTSTTTTTNSSNKPFNYDKVNQDIIFIEQCCTCRNIDNLSLSYKSATNRIMKSTLHFNDLNIPTLTELIQYYHTTQFPTCCQCASKKNGDDNIEI